MPFLYVLVFVVYFKQQPTERAIILTTTATVAKRQHIDEKQGHQQQSSVAIYRLGKYRSCSN